MADTGCSGSAPFKRLVNHHDYDRSLSASLTTKPNVSLNVGLQTIYIHHSQRNGLYK